MPGMPLGVDDLPDWERLLAAERHLQQLVPGAVLVGGTAALDGILTGIRQLRRTRPLETTVIDGVRVPTVAEMARIKAWLLATRLTVRDYLDTVVLFERLGDDGVVVALQSFDEIYRQPNGASPLAEVAERLAAAAPNDLAGIDLHAYRGLREPWNDWQHVVTRGRHWARVVARMVMETGE